MSLSETQHCSCRELNVRDIPGSELQNIEKATKNQLKFWLKCRELKFKSLDTRAELLSRVRLNVDKKLKLVDPDPEKCYTRALKLQCPNCSREIESTSCTLPTDNKVYEDGEWSRSAKIIPRQFSYINIQNHASKTSRKQSSFIEKPLQKGYKFFMKTMYLMYRARQQQVKFTSKASAIGHKKTEPPHNVKATLSSTGDVTFAICSCVAGAGGLCNHTMALLYLLDHTIKINAQTFPEVGTCTDNPQQWHRPRTQGVKPEPIMGYSVINPKYNNPSSGVKCTLYEARQPSVQSNIGAQLLKDTLSQTHPHLGFTQVFSATEPGNVPTKLYTRVPLGSILSYHISLTEGNIQVLSNFPAIPRPLQIDDSFPHLPYSSAPSVLFAGPQTSQAEHFLQCLAITDASATECQTRGQNKNPLWFNMSKNRLTSSNFGLICKRKKSISQAKFVGNTLLNQKDLSHIPAIKYGIDNESKAVGKYAEYMKYRQPVKILDCGTVISPKMPWLSTSPDRKVIDEDCGPGLIEVKCPYSLRNLKPEDACKDPNFFCTLMDGKPQLKRNHNYFYQVQGQLGICGLTWCDFVVYFQKGLLIERIKFDEAFWTEMITTLTVFYHEHVLPILLKEE